MVVGGGGGGGGSVNLPNRTQNGPKISYSLLA